MRLITEYLLLSLSRQKEGKRCDGGRATEGEETRKEMFKKKIRREESSVVGRE